MLAETLESIEKETERRNKCLVQLGNLYSRDVGHLEDYLNNLDVHIFENLDVRLLKRTNQFFDPGFTKF